MEKRREKNSSGDERRVESKMAKTICSNRQCETTTTVVDEVRRREEKRREEE
jgi:hypothetical protein